MFSSIFTPIAQTMEALSSFILWALLIYGVIQMASIVTIAVRTYYSLKIIKQVSLLLRDIIHEVRDIKREFNRP